ncbi:PhzF family phenazine biosynthesis protein [Novosphingobium sp.]|uniref:PhzF family phenazine biosynthesis protein n=1 Tax=Novosphingobium sp. TaxID=1874826 RepID=UPI003B51B060
MKLDLVDVFADGALSGNPLAVVHGADALDGPAMLALTRWLGFSETTFLLPPTEPVADYRVRIFYPAGELPFAGHPTLGSAAAWLAVGGQPQRAGLVVQQCPAGLIDVRVDGNTLAFRAPPLRKSGSLDAAERAEAIRVAGVDEADVIAAVHADNGPGWRLLHLVSADAVLAARPVATAPVPTDVGLAGAWGADHLRDRQWEVRAFFADANGRLVEDPVTGSLNASVGQYLLATGHVAAPGYIAGQGQCIGADGRIAVTVHTDGVWIGGKVQMVAQGAALHLPACPPS